MKCQGVGVFALPLEYSGSAEAQGGEGSRGAGRVERSSALPQAPPARRTRAGSGPRAPSPRVSNGRPGFCKSAVVSQADVSLVICGVSSVSFTCVNSHSPSPKMDKARVTTSLMTAGFGGRGTPRWHVLKWGQGAQVRLLPTVPQGRRAGPDPAPDQRMCVPVQRCGSSVRCLQVHQKWTNQCA